MKKKISKKAWSEWKWAWFMIAPTMIGLIVLNIIPIFQTLYLSFFKSGAFGKGNIFVGLENYVTLIHDPQVMYAVRNTLVYTMYCCSCYNGDCAAACGSAEWENERKGNIPDHLFYPHGCGAGGGDNGMEVAL